MNKNLTAIFSRNGDFANHRDVQRDVIARYQGRVPNFLLELWQEKGVGSWGGGLYWVCLPLEFDGLLAQVFGKDNDFSEQDCHVSAYTAFGKVIVWSERFGLTTIALLDAKVTCDGVVDPSKLSPGDASLTVEFFGALKRDSQNVFDDEGKPLFSRAEKGLGALGHGECYGFAPALNLDGAPKLENLRKMKAVEHFFFLAQLQEFVLMDYLSRPIRSVRTIG